MTHAWKFAIALVSMAALAGAPAGGDDGTGCFAGSETPDPLDPSCKKAPLSPPCLTDIPDGAGYAASEDPALCGFKRSWFIFVTPCGRESGSKSCI